LSTEIDTPSLFAAPFMDNVPKSHASYKQKAYSGSSSSEYDRPYGFIRAAAASSSPIPKPERFFPPRPRCSGITVPTRVLFLSSTTNDFSTVVDRLTRLTTN
jgi:hypothetical protein